MNRTICYAILVICLMGLVNCATGDHSPVSTGPAGGVITAASGTPQTHEIAGVFAASLVAMVTQNGSPASGVIVSFTAPTTGASGTFADSGTYSTTATTDGSGLATAAVFSANGTAGAYTVTASAPGVQSNASFALTNTLGAPAVITATSGTPQSSGINTAFAAPLVVQVLDSGQNPIANAAVVFQAPLTGASGIFANTSANTVTAMTDATGSASSGIFTANAISGADIVTATVGNVATPASFNLTNLAGAPATIVASSGSPQNAVISTAFPAPLVATVFDSLSNPVSGVAVTFSAPTSGASGHFANGTTTETDTTNSSGMATSTEFSANATNGGPYTVTATFGGALAPADFLLTNTLPFKTYVFYLSGQESSTAFYALAGSVQIDSGGNVLAGEQDYNDGGFGLSSPEPSGDSITGGSLNANTSTGQGTLTLITNNPSLGVGGTETLGIQFVNVNHALLVQFDGTATSSGGLDVQTLPTALNGGYAFTLTGVDPDSLAVGFGGVFTISGGTTLQNGLFDMNDAATGTVTTNTPLTGTLSTFDLFGRGTISSTLNYTNLVGSPAPVSLNYYVVGPEALRIIDVDSVNYGSATSDSAIGSAFGQGVNATTATNASLGNSVFGIIGNSLSQYAATGMFSTTPSSASFSGVGDDDELTNGIQTSPATPISGTYTIASNGYGSLSITSASLGSIGVLGVYLTDPNLNLSDPNNTTTGLGGALVADMDVNSTLSGGTGVVIPQTDTSTADFKGKYAFGGQDYNFILGAGEFDFLGKGSVTSLALSGTGLLSDPLFTLGEQATNSGVKFSGTALSDSSNPGHYTMSSNNTTPNPLVVTVSGTPFDFDLAIYQASGGLLFWLDEDSESVFLGSLQQQGTLTGLPAATNTVSGSKVK